MSLLARSSALSFAAPKAQDPYYTHVLTTTEIRECAEDLKVLGKKDFKALLKWRHDIRLDLGLDKKAVPAVAAPEAEPSPVSEMSVEEMLDIEAQKSVDADKKAKKKSRERKAKQLLKLRLGMATPMDIGIDAAANGDLGEAEFSLCAPDKRTRQCVPRESGESGLLASADEGSGSSGSEGGDSSSSDDEEEDDALRKRAHLEQSLDSYYEQYQAKKLEKNPKAMVKQLREQSKASNAFQEWYGVEYDKKLGLDGGEGEEVGSDAEEGSAAAAAAAARAGDSDEDVLLTDSESEGEGDVEAEEEEEDKVEGLMQMRKALAGSAAPTSGQQQRQLKEGGAEASLSKRAQQFFENPLFSAMSMGVPKPSTATKGASGKKRSAKAYHSSDSEEGGEDAEGRRATKRLARMDAAAKTAAATTSGKGSRSFETVPVQAAPQATVQQAAEDAEEEEEGDEDLRITTAQEYTLAKRMLRPSGKRDVVDESFNRYAFNDEDELPNW